MRISNRVANATAAHFDMPQFHPRLQPNVGRYDAHIPNLEHVMLVSRSALKSVTRLESVSYDRADVKRRHGIIHKIAPVR